MVKKNESLYLTILIGLWWFALNIAVYKQATGFGQDGKLPWNACFLPESDPDWCQKRP